MWPLWVWSPTSEDLSLPSCAGKRLNEGVGLLWVETVGVVWVEETVEVVWVEETVGVV